MQSPIDTLPIWQLPRYRSSGNRLRAHGILLSTWVRHLIFLGLQPAFGSRMCGTMAYCS
jgi:hypothetical protein